MTAAVVTLAIAVSILTIAGCLLGGLYVSLSKSHYELKAHNIALVVDHRGVVAQSVEKATRIARLERELGAAQADRDKYRAQAVAGLSDDDLRDLINGVREDKDGPSGSPDREPAPVAGTVSSLDGT